MPRGYARIDLGPRKRPDWSLKDRIENGDPDVAHLAVLCDNPACCEWGTCPHSVDHEKVTEDGILYNLSCGTCSHDPNATCQRVEVKNDIR